MVNYVINEYSGCKFIHSLSLVIEIYTSGKKKINKSMIILPYI